MLQTKPISLAAAGAQWRLDDTPGSLYTVKIEPGTHIAVAFGQDARKPAAMFTHANLAASQRRLHEFKHSRSSGSKYWTARPGVNLWFVFPKEAVTLLPEKGASYVPAMINGVRVTFNVSGGGGDGDGWTDYIGGRTQVSVGHSQADLRKVAAAAVRGTVAEADLVAHLAADPMDEREEWRFRQLLAAHRVPSLLLQRFHSGDKGLKLALTPGHGSDDVGVLSEMAFVHKMIWRKPTAQEREARPRIDRVGKSGYTNQVRWYVARFDPNGLTRVMPRQVDWVRTEQLNGLAP